MADVTATSSSAVQKAKLAEGPLKRPFGLRYPMARMLRKATLPSFALLMTSYVVYMKFCYFDKIKKWNKFLDETDNDVMFERMKEYGVFEPRVKPSWKTDDE